MQINPYVIFNGQCEAAFNFYQQCLGGTITAMLTYGSSPMAEQIPAESHGKIMHARLKVGDEVLMGSDSPPEQQYEQIKGISVALNIEQPAEAERVFNALAENGTIQMPIQPTFWAARFGMLVDQFGVPWMVNCE
jgi:PhnB protein